MRSQFVPDDAALRERYARHYYELAGILYRLETRHPQPVRAPAHRELPNLRRALNILLEVGEPEVVTRMANSIAMFLYIFGLPRERDELWKRVEKAMAAADTKDGGALTTAKFWHECALGEDELNKGNLRAACVRFTELLVRVEALPEGTPVGKGSFEHFYTLKELANYLRAGGRPSAAEQQQREALVIIETLIKRQPDDQHLIRKLGELLTELGTALVDQGRYMQTRGKYEKALEVARRQGDLRQRGVVLGQLGTLAQLQGDHAKARANFTAALEISCSLGERALDAVAWHQLGMLAQDQREWVEAQRCYRESLIIVESLGDWAKAAATCNQLAIVSQSTNHPVEAEGWYRRALELDELVDPGRQGSAGDLNNLAFLLLQEVQAARAPRSRLAEARNYAERALAIKEKVDASIGEIWNTLGHLVSIAEVEGRTAEARNYRRRERETFAAFEGNRSRIDHWFGSFIADVVAAAKGNA